MGALVGAGMGADPGTAVGDGAATTPPPPPPLDTGIWWPVVAAVGIVEAFSGVGYGYPCGGGGAKAGMAPPANLGAAIFGGNIGAGR